MARARVLRRAPKLQAVLDGLAAAVLITAGPVSAWAADPATTPPAPRKFTGSSAPALLSADDVINDDQLEIVTARGNVELSQAGRTVLADTVSYNRRTDTVIATGHVSVIEDATGETVSASYMELRNDMRDGFIRDLRVLLADRSRLAANTGRRTSASVTELRRAVYSACDLCKDDPTAPPFWQIEADSAIRNETTHRITYHDATIEFGGVPVFWTPYFSHPDPKAPQQSGFLAPTLSNNSVLGLSISTPYYFALGTDRDLTFEPIVTASQGIVIGGEYRQRFSNGAIDLRGSAVDSNPNPTAAGAPGVSTNAQLRGDLTAIGEFDLDDTYRAAFNIQRTSDLIFLQEYHFGNVQSFLTAKADVEAFSGRNYGVAAAYAFEPLELDVPRRTQPVIFPVVDYNWSLAPMSWGGQITNRFNLLDLFRETGTSSRRLSAGSELNLPLSGAWGQEINLVGGVRADGYFVTGFQQATNGISGNVTTGRVFPQIGAEWRWPWIRRDGDRHLVIEPMAAVYAAPVGGNPLRIPNDDSVAVDYSDADLFTPNRPLGLDQVDGGERIDYGVHAAWHDGSKLGVDSLVGQSYRFQSTSPFTMDGYGDGLDRRRSDYVGRINLTGFDYVDLTYRFRFDERDLEARRQEISVGLGPPKVRVDVNYIQLGFNARDGELPRQQLSTTVNVQATDFWSFQLNGTHDLQGVTPLLSGSASVRYADECTTIVATLSESGYKIGTFRPGSTFLLEIVLKNLGEIASPSLSTGLHAS